MKKVELFLHWWLENRDLQSSSHQWAFDEGGLDASFRNNPHTAGGLNMWSHIPNGQRVALTPWAPPNAHVVRPHGLCRMIFEAS